MNILVKLASGFMNLFTLGGEQFVSWVTGIIPTVLMLLLLMNAIIALAGNESVNINLQKYVQRIRFSVIWYFHLYLHLC